MHNSENNPLLTTTDLFNIKIGPGDVEIWEGNHLPNLADGVGIESGCDASGMHTPHCQVGSRVALVEP